MTAINELLDNLLKYSYQLSCLNMRQVAADYDYFATWIQSKDPINPSKHYGVAPAGENTIAPLADNCQIPFTQTTQLVNNCTNKEFAAAYTSLINEILLTLKDVYTSDEEVTAINEYIKYTNNVISLLNNGSVVPPTPPTPTLPTVALATYYTGNYVTNCSPGGFLNIYDGANLVPYDSTKTHIARVSDGHGGWLEWQFSCIEYAGDFAIKNMTSDTLSTYAVRLFSCSSTQAEIIYVYNSSNEKYQAFKFTLNETDYYYVADSVQNDWTDDLSSIGYSLEPIGLYAYFNRNNPGNNTSLFGSSEGSTQYNRLYEKDGSGSTSEMSFDPSYTYTVLHVYKKDGTEVLPSGGRFELGDSSNYLRLLFFNGGQGWIAAKIEYTKSSTEMTAYFNSGTKNNQKTVSSGWGTGGDQMEILYPLNSGKTIPYDSTKTYKVKTVFYKNYANPVTITNNYVTIDDLNYAGVHQGYLLVHTHVNNPATGNVCGCTFTVE